jgi:hypothetical protein
MKYLGKFKDILLQFGELWVILVYFSRFGMLHQKKLATLESD